MSLSLLLPSFSLVRLRSPLGPLLLLSVSGSTTRLLYSSMENDGVYGKMPPLLPSSTPPPLFLSKCLLLLLCWSESGTRDRERGRMMGLQCLKASPVRLHPLLGSHTISHLVMASIRQWGKQDWSSQSEQHWWVPGATWCKQSWSLSPTHSLYRISIASSFDHSFLLPPNSSLLFR